METQTILLLILAIGLALGMAYYQYHQLIRKSRILGALLAFLRFIAVLGILLLLINPKITKNAYRLEKHRLLLLADNSTSVKEQAATEKAVLDALRENTDIRNRFEIRSYRFGARLAPGDSLDHTDRDTDIAKALLDLNQLQTEGRATVILLSDGNQTIGQAYAPLAQRLKFPVRPVILGDTTRYEDLRVDLVNVNRYGFLGNRFPLEAYVSYEGTEASVPVELTIRMEGEIRYRERFRLSAQDPAKMIQTHLEAKSIGAKSIQVQLSTLSDERNTANNRKEVHMEVIDERTDIPIVSKGPHPDIGALSKALETNAQHAVKIVRPTDAPSTWQEADILVLYQPDAAFAPIYAHAQKSGASVFTIAGTHTDRRFLNQVQTRYQVAEQYPVQEVSAMANPGFAIFDNSDFPYGDYPPLESYMGGVRIQGEAAVMAFMQVRGIALEDPLLFVLEDAQGKEAVLFGENFWKWRMENYRNDQNFERFDGLIEKLARYLAQRKPKARFTVNYESLYEENGRIRVQASYFDAVFAFDPNAKISMVIENTEGTVTREVPLLPKGSYYEADLSGLPAGSYGFTATVAGTAFTQKGRFTVTDYDREAQFYSSDKTNLGLLARQSGGQLYDPSGVSDLIRDLTQNEAYLPVEKATEKTVSLIDFMWLFALIVAALALEWFLRKYNGLI